MHPGKEKTAHAHTHAHAHTCGEHAQDTLTAKEKLKTGEPGVSRVRVLEDNAPSCALSSSSFLVFWRRRRHP